MSKSRHVPVVKQNTSSLAFTSCKLRQNCAEADWAGPRVCWMYMTCINPRIPASIWKKYTLLRFFMFLPNIFVVQQPLICSLYFFYNCLLLSCFHVRISAAPCSHHPTKIRLQLWRPQSSCDFGATEAPILCDLMWSGHSSGILRNIEAMVVKMIWQSQHVCTSLVRPAMTRLRTLCIACSAKIGKKMARSRGICVSTEVKTVQSCCKTSLYNSHMTHMTYDILELDDFGNQSLLLL